MRKRDKLAVNSSDRCCGHPGWGPPDTPRGAREALLLHFEGWAKLAREGNRKEDLQKRAGMIISSFLDWVPQQQCQRWSDRKYWGSKCKKWQWAWKKKYLWNRPWKMWSWLIREKEEEWGARTTASSLGERLAGWSTVLQGRVTGEKANKSREKYFFNQNTKSDMLHIWDYDWIHKYKFVVWRYSLRNTNTNFLHSHVSSNGRYRQDRD